MSFFERLKSYKDFNFEDFFKRIHVDNIYRVLSKERLNSLDFLTLLSPAAADCLELMAQKSRELTLRHFGRAICLYAPVYLSNYCINRCSYCSFNAINKIERKRLSESELIKEADKLSQNGIRHILVLTGESRNESSVAYIKECITILKSFFTSISVEIYPLGVDEYRQLINAGTDGLTIYQETYDEEMYKKVHPSGPKRDYLYRLNTPGRGCQSGMRSVGIGALLGLSEWRREAFYTGLHGEYLQSRYSDTEISISLPRIRPHAGNFMPLFPVNDRQLVQIMLAMRLFLPYAGITLSTRENPVFRDNLVGLGVTRMSAGSSTEVGGYAGESKSNGQFEVSDFRSVGEICSMLREKGYQPVFKDWQHI